VVGAVDTRLRPCQRVRPPDGKFITLGASDDVARRIDALEREVGEGPCLDAILEERPQHDADITEHATWPELVQASPGRDDGAVACSRSAD
jgi:hypothetical protein